MTFACVIEYGVVSFLNRQEQQNRSLKKSVQSSLNNSLKKPSSLWSLRTKNNKNRSTSDEQNVNNSPLMWRKPTAAVDANVSRYANEISGESHIDLSLIPKYYSTKRNVSKCSEF